MGESAVPVLLKEYNRGVSILLFERVLLVHLCKQGFTAAVCEGLHDPSLSRGAVYVLTDARGSAALPHLLTVLARPSVPPRYDVAAALVALGNEEAQAAVEAFERDHAQEIAAALRDYRITIEQDPPLDLGEIDLLRFVLARYGTREMRDDFLEGNSGELMVTARLWSSCGAKDLTDIWFPWLRRNREGR